MKMNARYFLVVLAVAMIVACGWAQQTPSSETPTLQASASPAMPNEAVGSSAPQGARELDAPQFAQRYPRYQLTPGDVFSLSFQFSPELNQDLTIQPDGFVALREIGGLYIQDMTADQAEVAIKKAYGSILKDPVVTVVLKEFAKPYFIVGGQVHTPGKFDLRQATTVAEAIQIAGGFTEASKHSEVWLYRRRPDNTFEGKRLDMKKMLAKADLKEDLRLAPGDMVYVPQNTLSKLKGYVIPKSSVGPSLKP